MSELLPCPFCGGEAKGAWSFGSYCFTCTSCGTDKCSHVEDYIEEDAAKQWNTRAPTKQLTSDKEE